MYADIMTAEPNMDEQAEIEERAAADDANALQVKEWRRLKGMKQFDIAT